MNDFEDNTAKCLFGHLLDENFKPVSVPEPVERLEDLPSLNALSTGDVLPVVLGTNFRPRLLPPTISVSVEKPDKPIVVEPVKVPKLKASAPPKHIGDCIFEVNICVWL